MKRIANYYLIVVLVIVSLGSCKNILDPDVIDLPTAGNALRSSADIDKAVAGAYDLLRKAVPDKIFLMGDMRANLFSSFSQTEHVTVETPIPDNTKAGLLSNGGGNWSGFYTTIAQCNLIIETIPKIANYPEEDRNKHIGEAHFIRALTYFYLMRFWGDVPIVLKSVELGNIPRAPQAEVVALITKDLDIAIASLKLNDGKAAPTRATKGSAWAIKAHVAAWMQDYATAEKLCDSVIKLGGYRLVTDTTQLVNMFVGKSPESIFELNFDVGAKEVQKCRVFSRTLGMPWYRNTADGRTISDMYVLTPSRDQLNEMFPIGARDGRRFAWFIEGKYKKDRPFFGKYRTLQAKGDTTSENINESNIILTRLPDIMLLRAEALANPKVGKETEAIALLNAVRERAKATAYKGGGNLQDTILMERRRELIGEGHFFFDLVRTRKLDKYSKIKAKDWYESGAWLLPIDQNILTLSNNVVTQNIFWQ